MSIYCRSTGQMVSSSSSCLKVNVLEINNHHHTLNYEKSLDNKRKFAVLGLISICKLAY